MVKQHSSFCFELGRWSPLHLPFQHGKDFEAIQNNIAMRYKKRGKPANMVKNKEQVRHFYYRTWHKISKHIDFANGEFSPFLFPDFSNNWPDICTIAPVVPVKTVQYKA